MTKRTFAELKRLARESLTGNYTVPALAALIAYLLPTLLLAPFSIGVTYQWDIVTVTYIMAAVIVQILGQLLAAGVSRIHLQLAKKQQVFVKDVFWVFRNHPDRFILGTVLRLALCLVPALPAAAGAVYLAETKSAFTYLAAGLLVAGLAAAELYLVFAFEMVFLCYLEDPQITVLEGFRRSYAIMHGNKMKLFLLNLSFLGWQFLGMCSVGIGMLWISPYISQTFIGFYLDLTGQLDKKAEHIDVVAYY